MKKFTSIFLIISMIMCNVNTGVVEALATSSSKVKSFVGTLINTDNEEVDNLEDDKDKSNEVGKAKESNYSENVVNVDSKNTNDQVEKSSHKKIYTFDNEVNIQDNLILFYDIGSGKVYYINSDNQIEELYLINRNINKNNKSKINLNSILKSINLPKYQDSDDILTSYNQVTVIVTGTGENEGFEFDNSEYCDTTPFNVVFWNMDGTDCQFKFESIRTINIIGKNIIKNSSSSYTALEYSFDELNSNPLRFYKNGSFIAYNQYKEGVENNIVYSGSDFGEFEENSENTGYSSVVNISFEQNVLEGKDFILDSGSSSNEKKFSSIPNYNSLSILLPSDNTAYTLRESDNLIPYYYHMGSSEDENYEDDRISGPIRTKVILGKNYTNNCYDISNEKRVEVVSNIKGTQSYYLLNSLDKAMTICKDIECDSIEFVFLGNYDMSSDDAKAITNYDNKYVNKIGFKTKVDEYTYVLSVGQDIELTPNNIGSSQFYVIFDDIRLNYTVDDKWIYSNGRQLNFGNNVVMEGKVYPSISLGENPNSIQSNMVYDAVSLTINSGMYKSILGCNNSVSKDFNITINGGTFQSDIIAVNGIVEKNVTLNIKSGTFISQVLGVSNTGDIKGSLNVKIQGGTFQRDIVAVNGKVGKDSIININGTPTFRSRVLGTSDASNIGGVLDVIIKGGTFKGQVIGSNGDLVKNIKLTISNGTFDKMVFGRLSNTNIGKITLNSLFNRYLFINNLKTTDNQLDKVSSGVSSVNNINIKITGGNFKDNVIGTNVSDDIVKMIISKAKFKESLIGSSDLKEGNASINIEDNVTITTIRGFAELVVGSGTKKKVELKVDNLDKGYSKGNLYLKNESKVSIQSNTSTSKLHDIVLNGYGNILSLPPVDRNKEKVLIELDGNIINDENSKLNIEFNKSKNIDISKIYLIKFINQSNDITNKYNLPVGYYLRDNEEPNYVILYPQTTFDIEYDFEHNKLSMIDKNSGQKSDVWWYTTNTENIILDTDKLYQYKGYSLFKENSEDRNIILKGSGSNKNILIDSKLDNIKVVLNNIDLSNSIVNINHVNTLELEGVNTINSIERDGSIFNYTFNNSQIGKVLFKDDYSYLKIFTKDNTNPFNGSKIGCIDLKFFEKFDKDTKVRLENDNVEHSFTIPTSTQRIGLLLNDDGNYKLYHGEGSTGSSVYVAGNTDDTFVDKFEKIPNSIKVYEDVRRANPISTVNVEMPSGVNFGVHVRTNDLNSVTIDNWEDYFYTTDMKFKNNSIVVQDQFTDKNGKIHQFGKASDTDSNTSINLEYMGVYSSNDSRNSIELVSNDKLDYNVITDSTSGVKLALKLGADNIMATIDEHKEITEKSLGQWVISGNEKIIYIKPDFRDNNNFFNISKYVTDEFKLNSSHIFTFRYGLKNS